MSEKCVRRWWFGPLIAALAMLLCAYGLLFHFHQLPNWILFICAVLGLTMGMCLPMFWAASTGYNPYFHQNHCKRHAYWYDSRSTCQYCEADLK